MIFALIKHEVLRLSCLMTGILNFAKVSIDKIWFSAIYHVHYISSVW